MALSKEQKKRIEERPEQLRKLRRAGFRNKEIAYILELSPNYCYRQLRKYNIDANTPKEEVIIDYINGVTYSDMVKKYRVHANTLYRIITKARQAGRDIPYRQKYLKP